MIPMQVPLLAPLPWAPIGIGQAKLPVASPAPEKPSIFDIDGPVLAIAADGLVVTSSAMLAHAFGRVDSRWASVFWGVTAVMGFKSLLDLSRLYR